MLARPCIQIADNTGNYRSAMVSSATGSSVSEVAGTEIVRRCGNLRQYEARRKEFVHNIARARQLWRNMGTHEIVSRHGSKCSGVIRFLAMEVLELNMIKPGQSRSIVKWDLFKSVILKLLRDFSGSWQ